MVWLKAFGAGFLATLIFHQGVFFLFHLAGAVPMPWDMRGVPPLGIPRVISLAFWGGVWGLPAWILIRARSGRAYWGVAALFGALGPSLVALLIVFPLKGLQFAAGFDPKVWVAAFLLNSAWGIGVALFMQLFGARKGS